MSNSLIRAANRVSGLPPMARQVLAVLADEARDSRGGVSTLTTAQISDRTALSRRTIHRAYVILIDAGHISRTVAAPGAHPETAVHPVTGARAGRADLAEGSASVSAPPCQPVRGPIEYIDLPVNHSPPASAREVSISSRKEADEVDQVIAAWNAMAARCGLPGPVAADVPREAAIEQLLAREKMWRVLAAIDAVGRSPFLTGKRANGQGDWMATFDWVFEVRRFAGAGNFARILEGEFNRGQGVPAEPPPAPTELPPFSRSVEREAPEPERRLRAALRDRLGDRISAAWIDPLRFEFTGDGVRAVAPSAFHADYLMTSLAAQLRRAAADAGAGGIVVRIRERERV